MRRLRLSGKSRAGSDDLVSHGLTEEVIALTCLPAAKIENVTSSISGKVTFEPLFSSVEVKAVIIFGMLEK